ncbi:acyl-CoA dehydrogenase [Streptomyces sp. NPDC047028]|uniref:acyl-CoA dehydrogenase n=1 Tax=Streptomyces sp. NPDC047028 TaxID=3155793 RepID=UPI0033D9B8EF
MTAVSDHASVSAAVPDDVALTGAADAGAELERRLGDPWDAANPYGFRALLQAEERSELLAPAEEVLTACGFGARLVPAALGGRLTRADELARAVRPVFRRDLALGFGHGITSLFAASAVWAAGSQAQRAHLAGLLCGGGRVAIVHHNLAHGSAVLRGELAARPGRSGGYALSGRKDMVINAERADALVVYARTADAPAPGRGSHSVLLVDPAGLPEGAVRALPRKVTGGMRGCHFSGFDFDGCPVPDDALVGAEGDGVRLALRTFQLNRALIPAAAIASVDTALRGAVRAQLGSGRADFGRHGPLLAGVFADLLACDAFASATLRSLHLLPDSAHLAAAAVKYLVPELLRDDVEALTTVLAADSTDAALPITRALTAKLLRDLPAAGLGHAGTAACQAVIAPQLPLLARTSWFRAAEPPDAVLRPRGELPPLDLGALAVAGGDDFLAAALNATAGRLRDRRDQGAYERTLAAYARGFTAELWALHDRCAALPAGARPDLSSPEWCALVDRYALLSAAGAVLALWERCRDDGTFTGDPAWVLLALSRLAGRLGLDLPEPPEGCVARVLAEVVARLHAGTGYDLHRTPLAEGEDLP